LYRSTERILTTHTGSLPRPKDLADLIWQKQHEGLPDMAAFNRRVTDAVAECVQHQVECGVDIVSDGEQGRDGYATYVRDRLTGFEGEDRVPVTRLRELEDFPETMSARPAFLTRPACNGPIEWRDFPAVQRDIDNLKAAVDAAGAPYAFMTSASPGVVPLFLGNDYYPSNDVYMDTLASVLRREYEAIAASGIQLQIDCPDLAMGRHFVDVDNAGFRKMAQRYVELINEATKNIPPDQLRMHICWGNYEGPHHLDIPLKEIADIVLSARPATVSVEAANPRHDHEWALWEEMKWPEDKVIVPGVIDSTSNFIEHPELISQRIVRYANVCGRENVIAGSDCGFGTFAALSLVYPSITWAKLKVLSEGAAMASEKLWK
jgi:5-methyltetrahydropteroyltriglutamate--homocysteine methyltransferase